MNGRVAGLTHLHAVLHLFTGEPLLKPLVAVHRARNEMMKVVGLVRLAQLAQHGGGLNAGSPGEQVSTPRRV